jgi:hypothetical protein
MELVIKSSWEEITWKEYEQLEQILSADIPQNYRTVHIVALLTGQSVDFIERLPISQFQRLLPYIEFLNEESDTHTVKKQYEVNGRTYNLNADITQITTSQYLDYSAYMQDEEKDVVKLTSVFLIPDGHEYNDGYDLELVQSDINDLCWLDVRAIAFFFRIQLGAYILILKSSLVKTMKKSKAKKSDIKEVETQCNNMVWCLLYAESARKQIQRLMQSLGGQ